MSFAHFIIDMQAVEAPQFACSPGAWDTLCQRIGGFKRILKDEYEVPTVHVAYTGTKPMVGLFKNVSRKLLRNAKIDITTDRCLKSGVPIGPEDFFATKNKPSACTDAMVEFLKRNRITTVILSGVWEGPPYDERCCLSATAKDLVAKGFKVVIADEATNFSTHHEYCQPRDRHMLYRQENIDIMSMRGIVDLIARHAGKPFFSGSFPGVQKPAAPYGGLIGVAV